MTLLMYSWIMARASSLTWRKTLMATSAISLAGRPKEKEFLPDTLQNNMGYRCAGRSWFFHCDTLPLELR